MTAPQLTHRSGRTGRPRWVLVIGLAATFAMVGGPVATPPAAGAIPASPLAWSTISPPAAPPALAYASAVYDSDNKTMVLFGGEQQDGTLSSDTWVWNGSTWTKQHPAASPPARSGASMAYDAATGNLVLFGGAPQGGSGLLPDTWVWDGTTWTEQHPATSPSGREYAPMAYDAATGNLVLFGGAGAPGGNDTWVWDGTTWTEQHPATSPPGRQAASMAYDAATGNLVLFGGWLGIVTGHIFADTWVWG